MARKVRESVVGDAGSVTRVTKQRSDSGPSDFQYGGSTPDLTRIG